MKKLFVLGIAAAMLALGTSFVGEPASAHCDPLGHSPTQYLHIAAACSEGIVTGTPGYTCGDSFGYWGGTSTSYTYSWGTAEFQDIFPDKVYVLTNPWWYQGSGSNWGWSDKGWYLTELDFSGSISPGSAEVRTISFEEGGDGESQLGSGAAFHRVSDGVLSPWWVAVDYYFYARYAGDPGSPSPGEPADGLCWHQWKT